MKDDFKMLLVEFLMVTIGLICLICGIICYNSIKIKQCEAKNGQPEYSRLNFMNKCVIYEEDATIED